MSSLEPNISAVNGNSNSSGLDVKDVAEALSVLIETKEPNDLKDFSELKGLNEVNVIFTIDHLKSMNQEDIRKQILEDARLGNFSLLHFMIDEAFKGIIDIENILIDVLSAKVGGNEKSFEHIVYDLVELTPYRIFI